MDKIKEMIAIWCTKLKKTEKVNNRNENSEIIERKKKILWMMNEWQKKSIWILEISFKKIDTLNKDEISRLDLQL